MATLQHPTTIENLPDEVLSDIFIRLLAKQLAQTRCVCKPWNALLSESSFIDSHLSRSVQNNDETLMFFRDYDETLMFFRDCFSFDRTTFTARPSCSPDLDLTDSIKLPINLQHKSGQSDIIGSVNGLICFYHRSSLDDYVIHIWNPSLSAVFTLPTCPVSPDYLHFGFRFDPKTEDYKVVKLTTFFQKPYMRPQCEVYSMRKGSWEPISQSFPSHITIIGSYNNQVCVDDRLHWLGATKLKWTPTTIVAFDLGGLAFIEIPFPDSILHQVEYHVDVLGVLAGKLCVMSCVRDGGECVVWVMGEYGVTKSWVKHHIFPPFSGNITPYGFTLQNEFLFQVDLDDYRFGLYDPVAAKTKTFKIMPSITFCKVVEYVDSLVWIQPAKHETVKVKRETKRHRFY